MFVDYNRALGGKRLLLFIIQYFHILCRNARHVGFVGSRRILIVREKLYEQSRKLQ